MRTPDKRNTVDRNLKQLFEASENVPNPIRMDAMRRTILAAADEHENARAQTPWWRWLAAASAMAVVIALFMIAGPAKEPIENGGDGQSPMAALAEDPEALDSAVLVLLAFAEDDAIATPFFEDSSDALGLTAVINAEFDDDDPFSL